jgi:signal transduction histidine kinase
MTFVRSAARTAGFSILYLVAMVLGRLTVMDETNLSLAWPAAGILALWFTAQRESRWRWLDVLSLAVITMTVNVATGTTAALAAVLLAANLAQAFTFTTLSSRWLPNQSADGDGDGLSRMRQLWRLVAVASLSAGAGTVIGPTGAWLLNSSHHLWESALVWLTRNVVATLLIVVAGKRIGHLAQQWWRRRHVPRASPGPWRSLPTGKQFEYGAVLVASVVAYYLMFVFGEDLPAAFTLIGITVWAGLRLNTTFVVLHDLAFGSAAILFTLRGDGPFALIESHPVRALIAQLFVGTVTVVGLSLALSRDERDALTARLRVQAQPLTTVIDSISEGIAVVDENSGFLMRNPAIGRLLGGLTSPDGHVEASTYYGLFHPDGTPIAEQDLPHRRALAGEQLDPVEILIRNDGVPKGRIVVVNTALIPGRINGLRHVVIAMHDVTEDRRHRDELANFAGVVAHDLLNPLATIEGWSQAVLQDVGDPEALTDGITRIQRASTRMRALIDDLLAYTTARDAVLSPAHCDLNSLVADIAAGRRDHAQSTGKAIPVFRFSELCAVDGDPVLVRQLMENLIGNAIKYTAPGVIPTITITTRADTPEPGMTRVEVTDNGIGIPTSQHAAVFGNFHRAHLDADYTGTGLGLAICKRIVERHGGTITASGNSTGQGTRITFTLPSASLPLPSHTPAGPSPYRPYPSFERAH